MPVLSSNPSSVVSAGAWLTTTNVYTSDNTYATNTGATQNTEYAMEVGGFNFSAIPADATINSVTVTIEIKTGTNNRAQVKGELFDGTTALTPILALTNLTATDTNYTFTPTATLAQLKSANLKVRITNKRIVSQASTTSLDYVKIDVNYTVNPKTSTLTDTFDTQIAPATWSTWGSTVWEAGRVKAQPAALSGYGGAYTVADYDLTESSVYVRMYPPQEATGRETMLQLYKDDNNQICIIVAAGGGILFRIREGGVNNDQYFSPYDPAGHAWVRVRMSGTTVYADTSPDATVWTNQKSGTTVLDMTACRVYLLSGQWQTESAIVPAYFDNVNTAVAAPLIGTLVDSFDTTIDPSLWRPSKTDVVWDTGQVRLTSGLGSYVDLTALAAYDLRESAIFVKLTAPSAGYTSSEFNLRISGPSNTNSAMIFTYYSEGSRYAKARSREGGVNNDSPSATGPLPTTYWFRIGLSGSTLSFDWSITGTSWTSIWTRTVTPANLSVVAAVIECGNWQTEAGTFTTYVDNVNVLGVTGRPKVWTGSEYVQKPGKYWNGSAWVEKPWKEWDGSTWKTVK